MLCGLIVALCAVMYVRTNVSLRIPTLARPSDFAAYIEAGQDILHGISPYNNPALFYPPLLAFLMVPFALVDYVVALWSGEEEGLLGSLAYVKQHFGTAENPKPEWSKLDCYFNVDTGTGRLRGAGIFGPPDAAAVLRPVLAQFTDWGVFGASTTTSRGIGGTDSTSFNNAGLPGVGFSQDPIEYNTLTHHTNLDTYERIIPDDVQKAAAIVAAAVWHVANRDEMVPRFNKETMPPPVGPR